MRQPNDAVREHRARLLDWEDAHVSRGTSVGVIPPAFRGTQAPGFEHSAWQLLEHLRIAQDDLLAFCLDEKYVHELKWPDDYWPATPAPPDEAAWDASLEACQQSRQRLQQVAREVEDLTASVPTGDANQTYLRSILVAADHVAYHVGQIVAVRRALGVWR